MLEWLNNPIVYSGIASFFAALFVAKLFSYIRLSGLAVIAAFCATVYFIADFNFESLTIINKIILAGLVSAAIAPLLDLISSHTRLIRYVIILACSSVVIWVFWSVLQRKEWMELFILSVGLVSYIVLLGILLDRFAAAPIRASASCMGLGVSIGVSTLLSASALLGQMGFAIALAGGAYLLLQFFGNRVLPCGRALTLPLTVLCGLIAPAAMVLAKLPWYCLPLFLLVPVFAHIPMPGSWSLRWQVVLLSLLTLMSAAIPVLLIWHESGNLLF